MFQEALSNDKLRWRNVEDDVSESCWLRMLEFSAFALGLLRRLGVLESLYDVICPLHGLV